MKILVPAILGLLISSALWAASPVNQPTGTNSTGTITGVSSIQGVYMIDCLNPGQTDIYGKFCFGLLLKKVTILDRGGKTKDLGSVLLFDVTREGTIALTGDANLVMQALTGESNGANQKLSISILGLEYGDIATNVVFDGQPAMIRFGKLDLHLKGIYTSELSTYPVDTDWSIGVFPTSSKNGLLISTKYN